MRNGGIKPILIWYLRLVPLYLSIIMRIIIQKVSQAEVVNHDEPEIPARAIGPGLLLLVAVQDSDGDQEIAWAARKIAQMRIFEDPAGKMNLSLLDVRGKNVKGEVLSVSQFTLYADIRKGNRPSFVGAGDPGHARAIWERLNRTLSDDYDLPVTTGWFGAHMRVSLTNDGPVTIILDTDQMPGKTRKG